MRTLCSLSQRVYEISVFCDAFFHFFFFFQAEDGIRDGHVTGVQTCALPILSQSDTLKRSAPRPRRCKLWGDSRWNSISRRVEYICARWCTQVRAPWDHRFAPSPTRSFSSIHPALSDLTAAASWFTGRSPQISPSASLRVAFSRSLAAVSPILGSCVLCVKFLLSIHRCTSHPRLL